MLPRSNPEAPTVWRLLPLEDSFRLPHGVIRRWDRLWGLAVDIHPDSEARRAGGPGDQPAGARTPRCAGSRRLHGPHATAVRELDEPGADEAILVVDPIDERSIRALGEVAVLVRGS